MTIKVCHLTSVHPPFDIRIFYKECISLAKNGYEVSLIAPIESEVIKENIEIIPIHLPKSRLKRMLQVSFKMFRLAMKQKAKVYHFHDPELMLCGAMLKFSGKKVIYDIHENNRLTILDKEYLNKFSRKLLAASYYLIEKFFNLFYDQLVLALSEETYEKYYSKRNSTVVLNFPLPLKLKEISRKNDKDGCIRLIYVGVIHETRGIFEMLKLAGEIKRKGRKVLLDLVGQVRPDSLMAEIDNFKIEYDLNDEIVMHGFVNAPIVSEFISKAHFGLAFLFPFVRYQEALPTKFFEYMQQGLPVIANDYPLYRKYVEDLNLGINVDTRDLESAALKVIELSDNKEKLQAMREKGISFTSFEFNWASQEKKLLSLYQKLTK
ncbi:MAG: glycosyltransferase [Salinivirgaceae bacterium]|nr:glycosyltransferase [Salinivirgaceae bacterium]